MVEARYSTTGVLDFRTIPFASRIGIPFGAPLVARRSASHRSESALRSAIIACGRRISQSGSLRCEGGCHYGREIAIRIYKISSLDLSGLWILFGD